MMDENDAQNLNPFDSSCAVSVTTEDDSVFTTESTSLPPPPPPPLPQQSYAFDARGPDDGDDEGGDDDNDDSTAWFSEGDDATISTLGVNTSAVLGVSRGLRSVASAREGEGPEAPSDVDDASLLQAEGQDGVVSHNRDDRGKGALVAGGCCPCACSAPSGNCRILPPFVSEASPLIKAVMTVAFVTLMGSVAILVAAALTTGGGSSGGGEDRGTGDVSGGTVGDEGFFASTPSPTVRGTKKIPSGHPSHAPSVSPSDFPSSVPTAIPSVPPTTPSPSGPPSGIPSESPSRARSSAPSMKPTESPTEAPTIAPTVSPIMPSAVPTSTEKGPEKVKDVSMVIEGMENEMSAADIELFQIETQKYIKDYYDGGIFGVFIIDVSVDVAEQVGRELRQLDFDFLEIVFDQTTVYHTSGTNVTIYDIVEGPFDSETKRDNYISSLKAQTATNVFDNMTVVSVSAPRVVPTEAPTSRPSDIPSQYPTTEPSDAPTNAPTSKPTDVPTPAPTAKPTEVLATKSPTNPPTNSPTKNPTRSPTDSPTEAPCLDDDDWFYLSRKGNRRDCEYVAGRPNKRCDKVGEDGRLGEEACPEACDRC